MTQEDINTRLVEVIQSMTETMQDMTNTIVAQDNRIEELEAFKVKMMKMGYGDAT